VKASGQAPLGEPLLLGRGGWKGGCGVAKFMLFFEAVLVCLVVLFWNWVLFFFFFAALSLLRGYEEMNLIQIICASVL
jgi:hypothetical protein